MKVKEFLEFVKEHNIDIESELVLRLNDDTYDSLDCPNLTKISLDCVRMSSDDRQYYNCGIHGGINYVKEFLKYKPSELEFIDAISLMQY